MRSSLRLADPSASVQTDASEFKLVPLSNESIACSTQHIASYCRPFSTFASQLSCPRSTARLHHYSQTPKTHASHHGCDGSKHAPRRALQRRRILRKCHARRAAGAHPSRCSDVVWVHSIATIPKTRDPRAAAAQPPCDESIHAIRVHAAVAATRRRRTVRSG